MNKWALKQIKPETLLEVKMTKLKFSYFQTYHEKLLVLGKIRGQQENRKNEYEMY